MKKKTITKRYNLQFFASKKACKTQYNIILAPPNQFMDQVSALRTTILIGNIDLIFLFN